MSKESYRSLAKLSSVRIARFQNTILGFYQRQGRVFPWRRTRDPYAILVSEVMLQQTQADRVAPFFKAFLKKFPTPSSLAGASFGSVFKAWQGLGYNRRALYLKRAAEMIMDVYGGIFPKEMEKIGALPGVGSYTAAAVAVFAFGESSACIETNIRTVYLHFFFKGRKRVRDKEILKLVEQTLPNAAQPFGKHTAKPLSMREWYHALMDFGAMLKKTVGNPNSRAIGYVKQSAFKGSRRELRGKILKRVAEKGRITLADFTLQGHVFPAAEIFSSLAREGFLKKKGHIFTLM